MRARPHRNVGNPCTRLQSHNVDAPDCVGGCTGRARSNRNVCNFCARTNIGQLISQLSRRSGNWTANLAIERYSYYCSADLYIFGRQFSHLTAILAIVAPILPLDLQYRHWTADLAIVAPIWPLDRQSRHWTARQAIATPILQLYRPSRRWTANLAICNADLIIGAPIWPLDR